MNIDRTTFRFTDSGQVARIAGLIGLVGLAVSAVGYFADSAQFFHSYLTAFVYWLSISWGALFFTMLHHMVNARWSVVLRRLSESVMIVIPFLGLFFLPVLFGMGELYHWSHPETVAADTLLQKKSAYLNTGFFIARTALYFGIWILLTRKLYQSSLQQDQGHAASLTARFRRISAPGIILFALTVTFASFDWLMSLDAHWYSTIFGAYIFSGSFLSALAFIIVMAAYLRRKGVTTGIVSVEHFHDLGKLTFAFVIFWAYMAFSQYFLIWYANIPEETIWYRHRWEGSWKYVSLTIVFGHFALPFLLLITRAAKRSLPVLTGAAGWILFVRWVDLHWLVMPNLHGHGASLSWMDVTTMAGLGGAFIWFFWNRFVRQAVVPVKDPALDASIHFVNR